MTTEADRFWHWSLRAYAAPQVADLCLRMQDSFGANINVILACHWAAADLDLELQPVDIGILLKDLDSWSTAVTQPLRAARKALKVFPAPGSGNGDPGLRGLVKETELRAERLEQAFLAEALQGLAGRRRQSRTSAAILPPQISEKALINLDAYRQLLHINADTPDWTRNCRDLVKVLLTRIA